MKQVSAISKPVMLRIDYEADFHRDFLCDNRDHLNNILELMFGHYMGEAVYKILDKREECKFPSGYRDMFLEKNHYIFRIHAEFDYKFPDSKMPKHKKAEPEPEKENADEVQQERTETEDL